MLSLIAFKSNETLGLQVLRQIQAGLDRTGLDRVEVSAGPEEANYINNKMRSRLRELEKTSEKSILVLADAAMGPGHHTVRFLSAEGREVKASR